MPNPLPQGFAPRSLLDSRTIVAAGRLVMEKQFTKLVQAFARRRRPAARAGGCGSSARATSGRTWSARPASAGSGTGSSCPAARPTCRASGAGPASARSPRGPRGSRSGCRRRWRPASPCVTFDCASGPREIVRHEVNGLLVAPESIAGMSAALLRLGTDDDLRHRLGAGALDSRGRVGRRRDRRPVGGDLRGRDRAPAPAGRGTPPCRRRPRPEPPATPAYDAAGVTPAAARHAALSLAAAAARSATDEWLVVPPHETRTPVVVLPMAARHRFLQELAAAEVPSYLSLRDPAANGWHERRAPVPVLASDLLRGRTSVVAIEPWPTGADPETERRVGPGPGLHGRGGVLGGGRRRAAGRADPQPVRPAAPARLGHGDHRGRGRSTSRRCP